MEFSLRRCAARDFPNKNYQYYISQKQLLLQLLLQIGSSFSSCGFCAMLSYALKSNNAFNEEGGSRKWKSIKNIF